MEKYIVILIITLLAYYIFKCFNITEKFADTPVTDADLQNSILTLGQIAKDLQSASGIKVPGRISLNNSKQIISSLQMDEDNVLRVKNKDGGQMLAINQDGASWFGASNSAPITLGNVNFTATDRGIIQGPNGQLRINNQGIMFGGPNNGKELNSAQISAGLHIPNSLNIVGMSSGPGHQDRRVDMWAEGGLNVYGTLNVNRINLGGIILENTPEGLKINGNIRLHNNQIVMSSDNCNSGYIQLNQSCGNNTIANDGNGRIWIRSDKRKGGEVIQHW